MSLLSWGVPNGLVALLLLRSVVFYGLLGDIADQGSGVDEGGGIKHALLEALLHDFPNGRLGQTPRVCLLPVLLRNLSSLNQCCLHRNVNGAVIGYLVDVVCYYRVEDGQVPRP